MNRAPIFVAATAALFALMLLVAVSGARAAELVYWVNSPHNGGLGGVSFANVDGSGGGAVSTSGAEIKFPEGMAYDPVGNRLYVANLGPQGGGQITSINLDGSGATAFTPAGAPIDQPVGIAIDPATRTIYWANTGSRTLSWANLDGGGGGALSTAGARPEGMYRIALDPVGGRVYWDGFKESEPNVFEQFISYANVNNSGGGTLPFETESQVWGLATDPVSGRLYWQESKNSKEGFLDSISLGGGPITRVPLASTYDQGFGLAIDPVLGRAYWGNFGTKEGLGSNAIGFDALAGGAPGGVTLAVAPVNGPEDPVIIKSPRGTTAPQLAKSKAQLSCTPGTWAPDYPGGNVYEAPRSLAYQWTRNGAAVPGATAPTLTASAAGSYGCTVTATNQAGSTAQSGATTATVTAGKDKLTVKKKVAKAKPGKLVTFKLKILNQGDLGTKKAKLCLKLPKQAKRALKPGKCASLKALASGGKASAGLKLRVKPNAAGNFKLKITLPGTKAVNVTLKVLGSQKPH